MVSLRLPPQATHHLPDAAWRASRRETLTLIAYFAAVIAITDALNIRAGVELMTLAVVVAAVFVSRRGRQFARDWWFFLAGLVMWNLSGPIAANSPFPAHLDFLLHADRALLFGRQPVEVLQHALAPPHGINVWDVLTAVSYNLHLPEPYIAGYLLWRIDRVAYLHFAAAVLALLVLGFLTFIVYPAVPPWMAAGRYHVLPGVINRFGPTLRAHPLPFHGTPLFYVFRLKGDAVAAFPSEHAAFPLLELLAFRSALGRAAWPLLLWVLWILFSVVYLGEHWVTDVLAGWLYALACFAVTGLVIRNT